MESHTHVYMQSNMVCTFRDGCLLLALTLMVSTPALQTQDSQFHINQQNVKSAIFLSPKIELGPGMVANKYYYDVQFPRGHIALKSFNGEIVDEAGNPVPLHETYLHHWVVRKYYQRKGDEPMSASAMDYDRIEVRNSGVCQGLKNRQYFGIGAETRKTATHIPDPYGIEVGNPREVPSGYEEKWLINLHAIDTRGVVDKSGCIECQCELYNVTEVEDGRPLPPGYRGGLYCCYDQTHCRKQRGFQGPMRTLYLRYTVMWVDWNIFVLPLKIYILDVTDKISILNDSTSDNLEHDCKVEYQIKSCSTGVHNAANDCIHAKRNSVPFTNGGYVIYGVGHQHAGGTGSNLYGQDGRVLCSSMPIYGEGEEAGNEEGYIVGMSTCYPEPGSVKIEAGEVLTLESNYSSSQSHCGVMGLFYLLVAEEIPQKTNSSLYSYFQSLFTRYFRY